jgi:pimeloyl-ACP methyl ester carboxylesterase
MNTVRAAILAFMLAGPSAAQMPVSFPTSDGGLIHANQYGRGDRGVVLAHGGRFNKESWLQQALLLATAGFRVLAIDFRSEGREAELRGAQLMKDVNSTYWAHSTIFEKLARSR